LLQNDSTNAITATTPISNSNTVDGSKIVAVETKSVGDVSLEVYWFYIAAAGGALTLILLLTMSVWVAVSW
jgi:hypothetical protein